mmetsp:Transcript_100079/g.278483  ORF Transcript_100079/g.278483 Transcript_100079/m.278483 type:complete len:235 (+) Transcript_100079:469-1173(+)
METKSPLSAEVDGPLRPLRGRQRKQHGQWQRGHLDTAAGRRSDDVDVEAFAEHVHEEHARGGARLRRSRRHIRLLVLAHRQEHSVECGVRLCQLRQSSCRQQVCWPSDGPCVQALRPQFRQGDTGCCGAYTGLGEEHGVLQQDGGAARQPVQPTAGLRRQGRWELLGLVEEGPPSPEAAPPEAARRQRRGALRRRGGRRAHGAGRALRGPGAAPPASAATTSRCRTRLGGLPSL